MRFESTYLGLRSPSVYCSHPLGSDIRKGHFLLRQREQNGACEYKLLPLKKKVNWPFFLDEFCSRFPWASTQFLALLPLRVYSDYAFSSLQRFSGWIHPQRAVMRNDFFYPSKIGESLTSSVCSKTMHISNPFPIQLKTATLVSCTKMNWGWIPHGPVLITA